MPLQPKLPPGRTTRKVREYGAEIAKLLADGHTCEAVREALEEAGVVVSRSTVQREGARARRRQVDVQPIDARPPPPPAVAAPSANSLQQSAGKRVATAFALDERSGKEIAQEFMESHLSNPLIRERIAHEDRRD